MIISLEILEEYQRVGEILAKEYPPVNLKPMLDLVLKEASLFAVPPLPASVCEDPEDDKFLACALASRSKIIVSGDKHLLKISGYQNIEVLKPRAFLEKNL